MKDEFVCPECGQPLVRRRSEHGPGGWRYFCTEADCYGRVFGWPKWQLVYRAMHAAGARS